MKTPELKSGINAHGQHINGAEACLRANTAWKDGHAKTTSELRQP
jgi:hypothetical protein